MTWPLAAVLICALIVLGIIAAALVDKRDPRCRARHELGPFTSGHAYAVVHCDRTRQHDGPHTSGTHRPEDGGPAARRSPSRGVA